MSPRHRHFWTGRWKSPAQPNGLASTWDIYYARALVRVAQGRLPDALSDLRVAQRLGRAWRWSTPTNATVQLGAEGMLDRVHSALVEAGNRLYLGTHDPDLKQETFVTNEENRAVSLRTLWKSPKRENAFSGGSELPDAYWQSLAWLQRAEVAALKGGEATDRPGPGSRAIHTDGGVHRW
jgi:hypothetical protein